MNDVEIMKEHLKVATEMETRAFVLKQLEERIDNHITELKNYTYYCDGQECRKNAEIYNLRNKNKFIRKYSKHLKMLAPDSEQFKPFEWYLMLWGFAGIPVFLLGLFSPSFLCMVVGILLSILGALLFNKRKKLNGKFTSEAEEFFNKNYTTHNNNISNSQQNKIAIPKYITYYTEQLEVIRTEYAENENNLKQHYSQDIFPTKYRNLVAVATMYEWLANGRCDKIKGHGGLIDTYENNLVTGMIIGELQEANRLAMEQNNRLDRVIESQGYLMSEIRACNSFTENILGKVTEIERSADRMETYQYFIRDDLNRM